MQNGRGPKSWGWGPSLCGSFLDESLILKMNFAPEPDSFISTWLGGEEDFCCFLSPHNHTTTQPHHNHTPSAPPKTPSSMLFHILTLILLQPANFLRPRNLSQKRPHTVTRYICMISHLNLPSCVFHCSVLLSQCKMGNRRISPQHPFSCFIIISDRNIWRLSAAQFHF